MGRTGEILVGLDIGTTKVAAVVGEIREDGAIDIIGVGNSPSFGMSKGMVVHADQTTDAIKRAIREAEQMTGCTITAVYCNVSGGHLKSFNNRGVVSIGGDGRVSAKDIDRVIENARAVQIPADRQIIHTVPQEYLVDENDGYEDPLQIMGSRLQANVHIITALNSGVENVRQCPDRAGLHVQRIYSGLLASSNAVLTRDEMELGVVMVDIGGGTTEVAVWHNRALVHSAVLPYGGDHLTHDIATGLRTPRQEAERIKIMHGCALSSMVDDSEVIKVACVGGRNPMERPRTLLCDIIEPRLEEVFRLVEREIQASNFADLLGSGVVVTGGTALMDGIVELGEDVMNQPVRVGKPHPNPKGIIGANSGAAFTGGLSGLYDIVKAPSYSTAVGLLQLGAAEEPPKPKRGWWWPPKGPWFKNLKGYVANAWADH